MEFVYADEEMGHDEGQYLLYLDSMKYREEASHNYARYELYYEIHRFEFVFIRPIVENEFDHSWSMFDYHTYPGGSWRIHQLRYGFATFYVHYIEWWKPNHGGWEVLGSCNNVLAHFREQDSGNKRLPEMPPGTHGHQLDAIFPGMVRLCRFVAIDL